MEMILVILSGVALIGSTIYLIYFFKSLNSNTPKEEEKHYSNSNNYSGVNYNAEYKFDGKYKKNEYVTMFAVFFSITLFAVYIYFQYYEGNTTFNSSYNNSYRKGSINHIRTFGLSASALSGSKSSHRRSNYRRPNFRRPKTLRGRSSFRGRSYGGGGK